MVFRSMQKKRVEFWKYFIVDCCTLQVSAAGESAQGSGPNKKLAKRSAAESLLQIMGYSRPTLQPAKPALKNTNSNGSTASSSTSSSTMSTSSITNGEVKTTHSTERSKEKAKKVPFFVVCMMGEKGRYWSQKYFDTFMDFNSVMELWMLIYWWILVHC